MKKIFILSMVALIALSPSISLAKGGGGGRGGGFSSSRSSVSSSRATPSVSSRSSTPKVSTPKVVTPKAPKISTKPSTSTAKVTSTTTKTVNGKSYGKTGSVVGGTYQPKFRGGYSAPAGSTVYYRESSMMDWLPFYLILSSQNAHRDAVVVEPAKDGQPAKETVVKEEGIDTMYVINWIISILLVGGLIGYIVYKVNKNTKKKNDENSY